MKTLKYAVRFLTRAKAYTMINLLGLSFSLACCLMLARYIHRELTVDTHVINPETIVVPLRNLNGNIHPALNPIDEGLKDVSVGASYIVEKCKLNTDEGAVILSDQKPFQTRLMGVDNTFSHFFDYPIVLGELNLDQPDAAYLTEAYAKRLFGHDNPLGKKLFYQEKSLVVQGVIGQPTCKTSLDFDMIVPNQALTWYFQDFELLRVSPNIDLETLNQKAKVQRDYYRAKCSFRYITWNELYFDQSFPSAYISIVVHGDRTQVFILIGVAVLLLLVGIFNFVNLYMVYLMNRSKTFGVKKVFGLHNLPLYIELVIENILLVGVSLLVAWLIMYAVESIWPDSLFVSGQVDWFEFMLFIGILLLLPCITAFYPYAKYNYCSPITSMRSIATNRESVAVRMSFLFVQYCIALFLLMVSFYFKNHLNMLMNAPTGYQLENRMEVNLIKDTYVSRDGFKKYRERAMQLSQRLHECPSIENLVYADKPIFSARKEYNDIFNEKNEAVSMEVVSVPMSFFHFYGVPIKEGAFTEMEDNTQINIALNETALKALGYKSLDEAFIRSRSALLLVAESPEEIIEIGVKQIPVQAIVGDYFSGHQSEGIKPMLFLVQPDANMSGNQYLNIVPGKEKETLDYLRKTVKEIYNSDEVQFEWLSTLHEAQYAKDRRVMLVYSVFAGVAIVISCMGLFGLSLFDIRRRYKEIGVRKVNGAKIKDIWQLLFRKYVVVLLAAFAVATPLAVYFITSYTEGFAVKAPLSVGIFVLALLMVALISMGTMFWQVNRAARINPAEVIKSE